MPSLNFQERFADLVARGLKPHTIRARRKYPIKTGDTLYLFAGMRTVNCRMLRNPELCLGVTSIGIDVARSRIYLGSGSFYYPAEETLLLTDPEALELAKRDGFRDLAEFFTWFYMTHGTHFCGDLIEWRPS